ncbi:MAG TPA: hypothetical protein VGZ93_03765 [Candidatus Methylacidiphilales bacterium]|nr:hypothetical protein [Candidatus Methylacidiphilales bacterium]
MAHLIGLIKEKESLQTKLDHVNAELHSLETGRALHKKRGRKPGRPAGSKNKAVKAGKTRRGKRLKASMLKALTAAGTSGITVKELSAKLKVKPGNIFSWFYTTGKKISGIKKVGEAKYAYTS